ncbi:pectinesterase family protein [Streptomyces sp. CG1]|uniref:pectinesterase family protein n=1 Tax=Streptomyces sp. CG1 TaxID=1287523 RepID=UPI0034E27F20
MSLQPHRRSRATRRTAVAAGSALVAVGGLACIPLFAQASSTHSARTLTVAADGSAPYRTVQAAIDAASSGDTISVARGVYREVVTVPAAKSGLTLTGATGNPADVVITYDNAAGTKKPGGGRLGTAGSATATFAAKDLTVKNVTIANSFDKAAHPGISGQAVALNAEGDRQVYEHDRFLGHQDTLLAWAPTATTLTRQYFRGDTIAGDTDFLFGNADAVFDHDTLVARDNGAAAGGLNGFLTAANTDSSQKYGFLIANSTVSSTARANTYYLGRPWHPSATSVAQVLFRNTVLPAAIKKATPWTDMSGFSWKSARFASYADTGPGAAANANTPQLTAAQAAGHTVQKYLAGNDGWDPTRGGAGTGASANASASAASANAAAPGLATGDSRHVTEPRLPSTTCKTVSAHLTVSGRTFGAAAEKNPPDTAALQAALDACTRGGSGSVAVELKASGSHSAFLTGPLTVHQGETLVIDSGVTLYGSRNPASYQVKGKPTCGTLSSAEGGCAPLISVSGARAGIEGVRAGSGGQGRIDGRGDQDILGTSTTWWALARQAQTANENQQNPRLITVKNADDFTLYDIDLLNSPNFHVTYQGGTGFTAWGVRIKTPADARNTDGIDPGGATDVTIEDSWIQDGDDGIAIKGGSAVRNVTIAGNHFYGTHGISIGSETAGGVTNVLVENNTVAGTDSSGIVSGSSSGIRIKSSTKSGGEVSGVSYVNTCITGVRYPLVFDTHYANGSGSHIPYFTGITVAGLRAVNSPSNAQSVFNGYSPAYPLGLTLQNVSLGRNTSTGQYARIGVFNSTVTPSGTGVTVTKVQGGGSLPSCAFPAYPAL